MKKEKRLVSKIGNGGFSLGVNAPKTVEEAFPGYPSFEFPYDEKGNPETDSIIELEHALKLMQYSDAHPPRTASLHSSNIYFCIVFESREQQTAFLHEADLFRIGDKYLTGQEFADAFGIDLKAGKIIGKAKKGMSFTLPKGNLSFGASPLQFTKTKKPEISEKLADIRSSEKQLAKYMEWCSDPEFWICLVFDSEAEKANMLKALGLELEFGGKYLWCHDVARVLGRELIPCPFKNKKAYAGRERELESMVLDQGE